MGIIGQLMERRSGSFSVSQSIPDNHWFLRWLGGGSSAAGVYVNEATALNSLLVVACVRIISETIASLPLPVYKRLEPRGRERAREHALYRVLHDEANPQMSAFTYKERMGAHLSLWGNSYSVIERSRGDVNALWPVHPRNVDLRPNERGALRYWITDGQGRERSYEPRDILHIPGLAMDGLIGLSPLSMMRQAVGLSVAAETYGSRFFANDARPSVLLKHPLALSDVARKNLRDSWREEHGGENAQGIAILEEGMDVSTLSLSPEDAQFLECVTPDTRMTMADGSLKPARDVREGDLVLAWGNGPVVARVAAVGTPPIKPLVRIRTARGRELTATYDHPVLGKAALRTPGGRPDTKSEAWTPMGELQVGSYVRVGLGSVTVPDRMPFELAWMLGAMVGDGYIRAEQSSFTTADPAVAAAMREAVASLGGKLVHSYSRPYDWMIHTGGLGRGGSQLRTLFDRTGLTGARSHTKRVPVEVMTGGSSAWRGFLSGYLDADGSVRPANGKQQPVAYWSSVNRDLLADCQHLLALLGIQSAIYSMAPASKRFIMGRECETRASWGLYVTGAEQLRKLAAQLAPKHSAKAAKLLAFNDLPESRYRPENWLYDRVVSVEHLGPGETVGIEIEGVHTHITGGLVTHNTRRFQVQELARYFRIPPHLLADVERSTSWGTGIEQQNIGFVVYTMRPWLVRIEQEINRKLLPLDERDRYYAEFNVDGLLRGDLAARKEYYATARQWGWMSANDILELENQNPIPNGDIYLQPMNMVEAGTVPEPQPATDPEPNDEPPDDEDDEERPAGRRSERRSREMRSVASRRRLANAHVTIYRDTIARLVRIERQEVTGGIQRNLRERSAESFREWLSDYYYEKFPAQVIRNMQPVVTTLMETIAAEVVDELAGDDLPDGEVEVFARDYVETYAKRHCGDSRSRLLRLLNDYQAGRSTRQDDDLADVLEADLEEWPDRVDGEATDEAHRSSNAVASFAYGLLGILTLRWVATGSEPCDYCQAMDGRRVNTGDSFLAAGAGLSVGGLSPFVSKSSISHPPLHSGCLCVIAPG